MKHITVTRAAPPMLPSNIGTVFDEDFFDDGVKFGDAAFKTKAKRSTYMLYEIQTPNGGSKARNSYRKSGYV